MPISDEILLMIVTAIRWTHELKKKIKGPFKNLRSKQDATST